MRSTGLPHTFRPHFFHTFASPLPTSDPQRLASEKRPRCKRTLGHKKLGGSDKAKANTQESWRVARFTVILIHFFVILMLFRVGCFVMIMLKGKKIKKSLIKPNGMRNYSSLGREPQISLSFFIIYQIEYQNHISFQFFLNFYIFRLLNARNCQKSERKGIPGTPGSSGQPRQKQEMRRKKGKRKMTPEERPGRGSQGRQA